MIRGFEVEVREARPGREPTLRGVMLQEGRVASERREVFAPYAVAWPSTGVAILTEHRGAVETRAQVVRGRDGRLSVIGRATEAIQEAIEAGRRFLSVEFRAIDEHTTAGGVREIRRAFVDAAALVDRPEYTQTSAEVRSNRRRRLWL